MNHFVHLHGSQENKHPSAEDEKNDRGFARKVLDYGLAL
jgi:hypothetical protein